MKKVILGLLFLSAVLISCEDTFDEDMELVTNETRAEVDKGESSNPNNPGCEDPTDPTCN